MSHRSPEDRSQLWIWWVCGLLLLASTINYMDRQTLANTSVQITREFDLSEEQYGTLETAFGLAFAVGASLFGFISDRVNIRWLYPIVLLLWSAMGFATGLVETYFGLLLCRMFLGLFEAGHWPCALKTTQRLLPPDKRTLGNSVLQSGTAIGAMVTPLIIKALVDDNVRGSWRPAFQVVAAVGVCWIVFWLLSIRSRDLISTSATITPPEETSNASLEKIQLSELDTGSVRKNTFLSLIFSRRFLVLIIVVIAINLCWHQFRVWMMKFLVQGRGYSRDGSLDVNFWFNVMTDIGCLSAGFTTAALCRGGWTVHGSRTLVFGVCSLLVASGGLIPWLPAGPWLIAVLMAVGIGSLGLFPCYYALSQELSITHQGKVTGILGTIAWVFPSLWHREFGAWVDQTKSYDIGMFLASLLPLVAWAAMLCLWPRHPEHAE
ncbi:MAG: dgoT 2 [Planctomycetaceae bacterium]|nr:dgoT 2 [Planctomycetaceae bacterium]